MNVDGSSTPVIFDYEPGSGETWIVEQIGILILDSGDMSNSNFGSISSLTNGLDIKIEIEGTSYVYKNLKDNTDIVLAFPEQGLVGNSSTGFLSEEDYYVGLFRIPYPIKLHYGEDDSISAVVNDDLTGIGRLRMSALLWRPV